MTTSANTANTHNTGLGNLRMIFHAIMLIRLDPQRFVQCEWNPITPDCLTPPETDPYGNIAIRDRRIVGK